MKKYTVIYRESFMVGFDVQSIVQCDRIETDDLRKYLDKYDNGIEFVFEGHCVDVA